MLYCSLPFSTLNLSASISGQMGRDKIGMKSDCHGPRLGPGPSVSRGRWSERSVVTIWKCCRDQSCLASSRSGSLFREKERAVNPHHFNTPLSFYNKPFDVQKYFCWCRYKLKFLLLLKSCKYSSSYENIWNCRQYGKVKPSLSYLGIGPDHACLLEGIILTFLNYFLSPIFCYPSLYIVHQWTCLHVSARISHVIFQTADRPLTRLHYSATRGHSQTTAPNRQDAVGAGAVGSGAGQV